MILSPGRLFIRGGGVDIERCRLAAIFERRRAIARRDVELAQGEPGLDVPPVARGKRGDLGQCGVRPFARRENLRTVLLDIPHVRKMPNGIVQNPKCGFGAVGIELDGGRTESGVPSFAESRPRPAWPFSARR